MWSIFQKFRWGLGLVGSGVLAVLGGLRGFDFGTNCQPVWSGLGGLGNLVVSSLNLIANVRAPRGKRQSSHKNPFFRGLYSLLVLGVRYPKMDHILSPGQIANRDGSQSCEMEDYFPYENWSSCQWLSKCFQTGFRKSKGWRIFGKRLGEGFLGMKFYLRICWLDWWGISWLAPWFFDVSMSLHAWIRIYQKIFLKVAYVWIGFVGLLCVLWREQNVSKCDFSFFLPETVLFSTSRSDIFQFPNVSHKLETARLGTECWPR